MINRDKEKLTRFKSGKLILAIVAVAFFQIAFVLYIVTDKQPDFAAGVPVLADITANIPDENAGDPSEVAALNTQPTDAAAAILPPRPQNQRAKNDAVATKDHKPTITKPRAIAIKQIQRPIHANSLRLPELYATGVRYETRQRGPFRDTIITYRTYEPSYAAAANVPKTKKRSLLAKAMPVLKKPWDLLKAIGSRLD